MNIVISVCYYQNMALFFRSLRPHPASQGRWRRVLRPRRRRNSWMLRRGRWGSVVWRDFNSRVRSATLSLNTQSKHSTWTLSTDPIIVWCKRQNMCNNQRPLNDMVMNNHRQWKLTYFINFKSYPMAMATIDNSCFKITLCLVFMSRTLTHAICVCNSDMFIQMGYESNS